MTDLKKALLDIQRVHLSEIIYMVVYLVCAIFMSIGKGSSGNLCCMSDIVLDSAYKNMFILAPFVVIVMIMYYSGDFRISVILRYEGVGGFVGHIWKKAFVFAGVLSVVQCILVCVAGTPFGILTNWGNPNSYICTMYGVIMKNAIPIWQVIITVWASMFMELLLLQEGLCVTWLIFETPVAGLMITIILVALESALRNGFSVFFTKVGIEIGAYVTGTTNIFDVVAYTIVVGMALTVLMMWIAKKKDYYKVV